MNNGVADDADAGGGVGYLLLWIGLIVIWASLFLVNPDSYPLNQIAGKAWWVLVPGFGLLLMVPGAFLYLFSLAKGSPQANR